MSPLQYHALWIAIALAATAVASGVIARRLCLREVRRRQTEQALDALARYCEWLAAQRHAAVFQGEPPPERSALVRLCALQQAVFPQLCGAMLALLLAHARMLDFLATAAAARRRCRCLAGVGPRPALPGAVARAWRGGAPAGRQAARAGRRAAGRCPAGSGVPGLGQARSSHSNVGAGIRFRGWPHAASSSLQPVASVSLHRSMYAEASFGS